MDTCDGDCIFCERHHDRISEFLFHSIKQTMRLSDLTTAAIVLLLNYQNPGANGRDPLISAEIMVYLYVVKIETTIKTCGRVDPENLASYDKLYTTYRDETSGIAMKIGFLVGKAARLNGIDKGTLLDSMEYRVGAVVQEVERTAERDLIGFVGICRNLPKAAAAKIGPFEPLAKRFPQEMSIIQKPEDMENVP